MKKVLWVLMSLVACSPETTDYENTRLNELEETAGLAKLEGHLAEEELRAAEARADAAEADARRREAEADIAEAEAAEAKANAEIRLLELALAEEQMEHGETREERDEARRLVQELNAEVAQFRGAAEEHQREAEAYQDDADRMHDTIRRLEAEVESLRNEIAQLQATIQRLEEEIARLLSGQDERDSPSYATVRLQLPNSVRFGHASGDRHINDVSEFCVDVQLVVQGGRLVAIGEATLTEQGGDKTSGTVAVSLSGEVADATVVEIRSGILQANSLRVCQTIPDEHGSHPVAMAGHGALVTGRLIADGSGGDICRNRPGANCATVEALEIEVPVLVE